MIRLWYSNHLEALVDALIDNVRALREAGATDPFQPTTVIVPNRNIATYLKFSVARRTGVLANWHFEYLYRFFRDSIVDEDVQVIGKDDLHTLLLDVLADDTLLAEDDLGSVREYIDAGRTRDDRDRRTWQLASELAHVFEEYALSRPRMLQLWPSGPAITEEPFAATEAWQRRIWLELFEPNGRLEEAQQRAGKRLLLMPDLFSKLRSDAIDLPPQLHVFGLSYVARSFYKLFAQLSERTHVLVYGLNPCMEYWEDIPSGWNISHARGWTRRESEQSFLFGDEEEIIDDSPPALRAWGRPGRDNIRMMNMLTDSDFAGRFVDPNAVGGDTLLHRFQRDILVRQPVSKHPDRSYDDDSIRVLECPNIQREVEVVANEILDLKRRYAANGESLEFHDVAVIVNNAQREAYQARIRSIFSANHDIPHNIIDITASAHRRYLDGVELLLGLPFGRFTRREMLRLMTHDNVIETCDGVDPQTWVRWCDELNILHGADRQDHEGTYIDENLYHWDQGLKRLVLGTFMTGELAGDERIATLPDGDYLPYELSPQEVSSAAQMVTLARSLIRDARALAREKRPLSDWMTRVTELLHRYLAPVDDDDEYDRLRVVRFLRELRERDLSSTPVSFRIAHEFIRASLAGLEISRGQYLSEGVVVSSFLPMRPIPFKVVFVTGMGERHFPRSDVRSPLDLRWSPELKPVRGDVISARAQDEYMFLETLISTRDRFYLSYVARDSQTGEDLEPSSVLRLLWFILEQNYCTPEALEGLRSSHPLRRWDDEYFEGEHLVNYQPEAHREATALRDRLDLERFCQRAGVPFPDRATLERDLEPDAWEDVRQRLALVDPPEDDVVADEDGKVRVSLWQIRKFLETPIQGAAHFFLGMREDRFEDPFGVEDEVFETSSQTQLELMQQAFVSTLAAGDPENPDPREMERRYHELARHAVLRGTVPSGPFGEADRNKHVEVLEQWLQNYLGLRLQGDPVIVNFGRATSPLEVARLEEPLRFTVELDGVDAREVEVEVVGKTELWWPESACSLLLSQSSSTQRSGGAERPFLRGFIDQAILAATEISPRREWTVAINLNRKLHHEYHVRKYDPFDPEQARLWLLTVVSDMLARMPSHFLPVEAVFAHKYDKKKHTIERWLDEYKDKYEWCSYKSGPVHDPQKRFSPPPDPAPLIARRFDPYFARRKT